MEWKNSPDLFNDYVFLEECPRAMAKILLKFGWFFDDIFFYWLVKGGKIVKRRPLYWYPQKSTPTEKARKYIRGKQTKLVVSVHGP
jgi:hypothetical protein